ncbi:uncharacterized protein KQ657_001931 [Scheffersomyces spartinae]|uniref:GPN-loop GTPase 2 n=1 Tax=Scheffersomyces spartinae TaxID=45513 RepID=A0A9P7V6V3_9ASCO|nr:uncharacterized protein KQ657_001931 [Scheffersomyces spartinae]KAG7192213.1 hypothetical protein KQ657_001931 [Scheffersomyces spartinae]
MFGQVVIGPPGSGKSTYCYGMHQFLNALGRKNAIINLDPANDHLQYPCALDIREFITLEDVMTETNLGPNGGLMYAMELLRESANEFIDKVVDICLKQRNYVLFDCPGQVELFTHDNSLGWIFRKLNKQLRLCVVQLIDVNYLMPASNYISVLLLALRAMLQLDLPQVNVLSKIDMVLNFAHELPYKLDYYTDVNDLHYLIPHVEAEFKRSPLSGNFIRLTEAIADLIESYGLVQFEVLAIEDKQSMIKLLTVVDKAMGYALGTNEVGGDTVWTDAMRIGGLKELQDIDIHERWVDNKAEYEKQQHDLEQELQQENLQKPLETSEDEWERDLKQWQQQNQ